MEQKIQYSFKDYMNKVLAGTASGVVVGLIANAILGGILKALIPYGSIFATMASVVTIAAQSLGRDNPCLRAAYIGRL